MKLRTWGMAPMTFCRREGRTEPRGEWRPGTRGPAGGVTPCRVGRHADGKRPFHYGREFTTLHHGLPLLPNSTGSRAVATGLRWTAARCSMRCTNATWWRPFPEFRDLQESQCHAGNACLMWWTRVRSRTDSGLRASKVMLHERRLLLSEQRLGARLLHQYRTPSAEHLRKVSKMKKI